jgi:hypothetical protein
LEQRKEWRFQVTFEPTDPPQATFVSRGWGVPEHARWEANHYFDDVAAILGPPVLPEPAMEDSEPMTAPLDEGEPSEEMAPNEAPPIDVEELEPA